MVMVSARLTRRWRLSYRHDLTNAAIAAPRRLVAVRCERLADIRTQVSSIDTDLQNKLTFEGGPLACLSQPVKDILAPTIYRMCGSLKQIAQIAELSPPNCKTEREQRRPGQPLRPQQC
jgi:hypothetical protein